MVLKGPAFLQLFDSLGTLWFPKSFLRVLSFIQTQMWLKGLFMNNKICTFLLYLLSLGKFQDVGEHRNHSKGQHKLL